MNTGSNWTQAVFGKFDPSMKGVDWGLLYNDHKDDMLDPADVQRQVRDLLSNEEVTRKSGIYRYVLTGEEKFLSPRQFDKNTAMTVYNQQNGCCAICGKQAELKSMHADHKIPWSKGGRTEISNCQMLCVSCNLAKSDR